MKRLFVLLAVLAAAAAIEWATCETCRLSLMGIKLFIDIDANSSVKEVSGATCQPIKKVGAKKSAQLCDRIIRQTMRSPLLMKKIKDNKGTGWEKKFCAKEMKKKYCNQ
ncbi:hypothetical protein Aduo_002909 [Ancylostoma duodenale]